MVAWVRVGQLLDGTAPSKKKKPVLYHAPPSHMYEVIALVRGSRIAAPMKDRLSMQDVQDAVNKL
jgi:hypothetical protein